MLTSTTIDLYVIRSVCVGLRIIHNR